ncbi:hypothetical protein ACFJGW_00680 [Burkholderiaceae bacterium UC74_6]
MSNRRSSTAWNWLMALAAIVSFFVLIAYSNKGNPDDPDALEATALELRDSAQYQVRAEQLARLLHDAHEQGVREGIASTKTADREALDRSCAALWAGNPIPSVQEQ